MDLVVDHVAELEDVGRTHGNGLAELLAGAAVEQTGLAALVKLGDKLGAHVIAKGSGGLVEHVLVGTTDDLGDLVLLGAVVGTVAVRVQKGFMSAISFILVSAVFMILANPPVTADLVAQGGFWTEANAAFAAASASSGACLESAMMCLLSHRKSFISNNPIVAQLRAYLLVFAYLFAYRSLFSHSWQMFAQLCALSRKTMRMNAHATILVKHKEAEHQSPKEQSRP